MSSPSRPTNPPRQDSTVEPFPAYPPEQPAKETSTTTTTTAAAGAAAGVVPASTSDDRSRPSTATRHYVIGPSQSTGPATTVPPATATSVTTTTASAAAANDPDASPYTPHVLRRRPINIRRLPSGPVKGSSLADAGSPNRAASSRARSTSAPQAPLDFTAGASYERLPEAAAGSGAQQHHSDLPPLDENPILARQMVPMNTIHLTAPTDEGGSTAGAGGRHNRRSVGGSDISMMSRRGGNDPDAPRPHEYESEVVDLLDVIDPEVAALTTLTNVQNSLFVPDLGRWVNRRPTYTLSRAPSQSRQVPPPVREEVEDQPLQEQDEQDGQDEQDELTRPTTRGDYSWEGLQRTHSISSDLTDSHYAVLPHGLSLEGWSDEDKEALDDYVRHMLHSKRSKFKQIMKAFGKYMKTPLGFFVTLYATLITLFGLAWVLFLIGWIYAGSRQNYVVNVIDNVLVALFALMGDGLAPFRVVDTYHMIYIAHYHRLSWKLRQQRNLPQLKNHNDLPTRFEKELDPEAAEERAEFIVLTTTQQKKLIHHQTKFSKSHTYYKPHETLTHHAFPIKLLILVVVMLDCHSVLQIMLGTFTWAWSYHTRPEWITSVILSFSITINVGAGVVIAIGDRITRKKDVVKRLTRQKVTQEAMKKVHKSRSKRGNEPPGGKRPQSGKNTSVST